MTKGRRKVTQCAIGCLAIVVTLTCVACVPIPDEADATDATQSNRNANTIYADLYMYNPGHIPAGVGDPVTMSSVIAKEWEANHPGKQIRYQVLSMLTGNKGEGEDLKTQLLGGIAPEIMHLNAEVAWPDVGKGWYVPLDEFLERPNPYAAGNKRWIDVFKNQALVNAKRAPDGKLYCLPIDMIETAVFYNKNMLADLEITPSPATWADMLTMFDRVAEAGVTPLAVPMRLGADWGEDVLFEMLYHDILPELDLIASRENAAGYLGHYLEPQEAAFLYTKGFFTRRDPRWVEMHHLLRQWRDYWPRDIKNSDFFRLFVTRRVAMMWASSDFTRRMIYDPLIDFEWGVFYFPPMTERTSRFACGSPASVIGGAAVQLHVTNSALLNEHLEDCIDFLMYLTAPQNAGRMINEAAVYSPNIAGVDTCKELLPFGEILRRPYCAIKWLESLDGREKQYWRRMQDYWLQDGTDVDGYLAKLEEDFASWVKRHGNDAAWDFDALEAVWKERKAKLSRELEAAN